MTRWISFVATTALVLTSTVSGSVIPANWTSTAGGTIDGIVFTAAGFAGSASINPQIFSGGQYSAAPIPTSPAITYAADDNWSLSFASPLNDLFLYLVTWRGDYTTNPDPTTTYTFNQPFTIASGLLDASSVGNSLMLSESPSPFHSGVLRFSGPISNLSVVSDATRSDLQALTFSTTQVPEPGSWALLGLGLIGLRSLVRRRSPRP